MTRNNSTVIIVVVVLLLLYDGIGRSRLTAPAPQAPATEGAGRAPAKKLDAAADDGAEAPDVTKPPKKRPAKAPKTESAAETDAPEETPTPKKRKVATKPRVAAGTNSSGAGDCFPVCLPLELKSGAIYVRRTGMQAVSEPGLVKCAAMKQGADGKPYFSYNSNIKRIVIDVGTNADPDSQTDYWGVEDVGFVWFEPQVTLWTHPMHLKEIRAVQGINSGRVVGFPGAVSPSNGHFDMYLSAISGCTSLLEMNDEALKNPGVMKGSFVGSDKAFSNWATAKGGFTGCIEKVKGRPHRETIPTLRGEAIMAMIPPELPVFLLSIDAQGFDLTVASSFGKGLGRAEIVLIECQDLPFGHGMFLTKGAFSCADIRACMEEYLPSHKMVDAATGEPADTCTINNPSHERNCMFRNMDKPHLFKLPFVVQRPAYKIKYDKRENLQCPSLLPPQPKTPAPTPAEE